ncbi:MAG: hypothetical protein IJ111_07280 [Eggerthellaceae bacterium]|nr:hypothetical protein [Eggerthellaceae bacterium]
MRSVEVYRAQAAVKKLTESTRPGEAIRALAELADDAEASPFERYAASVLRNAGALELTRAGAPEVRLLRTQGGQLVRLSTPTSPGNARGQVLALEDALNRLVGVVSALTQGIGTQAPEGKSYARARRQKLFESYGVEYPLWSDTERGAHVTLPSLGSGEKPDDAFFNEIDWRMLDTVANNAHVYFQAAILTNLNQVIFGVKAPHCSEWDVRTRLASILGGLEPPLRFSYKFDFDTSRNAVVVHFTVPSERSFPALSDATLLPAARIVYALRFSASLGAACFGSGRIIDHAFVVGKDEGGRVLVSCAFDRAQFVHETLPVIDAGQFADPGLRFDPEAVAQQLSAAHVEYVSGSTAPLVAARLAGTRFKPREDERELPVDLQWLFHAKRACDVDTTQYMGGNAAVIDEARSDSTDSLVSAIARLEGVVADLETSLVPPEGQPEARPLFCEHALARVAVALLGDELNVASEAEAFLYPEIRTASHELPDVYYYRAPDALFHAYVGLADLNRKLGDVRDAEAQADRCIALAPTTSAGYALKADALAGQGRYKEAANVIMTGLQTAVAENDQAFLLHDLAQLFWRMGRSREASALHIHTASLSGIYAAKSLEFVKELAGEQNVHEFIRANTQEASHVISATGIPLVSGRTRQLLIAQAALGLSNAHMPNVATPYIAELARRFPTNRAITEACNSIRFGIV